MEVTARLDFVATSEAEYQAHAASDHPAWPAFLPAEYIEEPRLRIQAYRQLAGVSRLDELETLQTTWRDRFGRLPVPAENLLEFTRLKLLAASKKVQGIEVRGEKVMFTRAGELLLTGGKFPRLTSPEPLTKLRQILALLENL